MLDLGYSGNPFTWTNGRHGRGLIKERLDRGLVNREWCLLFPRATVTHIARVASDHAQVILNTLGGSSMALWTRWLTLTGIFIVPTS